MPLEVNQAHEALPSAIRNRVRLDLAPNLLKRDLKQLSQNYEVVGGGARSWNRVNGFGADCTDDELRDFQGRLLADRRMFRGENLTTIYPYHHADGSFAMRGACDALGWSDLSSAWDVWCRAFAGYLVLPGCPGRGHSLSEADQRRIGPGAFVGTGAPPNRLKGARNVCWAGHRSAVQASLRPSRPGEYGWSFNANGQVPMFLELVLRDWKENPTVEALRSRGAWRPILTPEEREIAERVIAGDNGEPLARVVSWVAEYPLARETFFERRTGGVACIVTESPGVTTADVYASTWTPGASGWLIADTGGRSTGDGDPDVRRGHARIDWQGGTVTAERDDRTLPKQTTDLPPGETVYRVRSAPGIVERLIPAPEPASAPDLQPAPAPAPRPTRRDRGLPKWVLPAVGVGLLLLLLHCSGAF